jgi:hypothetical protein
MYKCLVGLILFKIHDNIIWKRYLFSQRSSYHGNKIIHYSRINSYNHMIHENGKEIHPRRPQIQFQNFYLQVFFCWMSPYIFQYLYENENIQWRMEGSLTTFSDFVWKIQLMRIQGLNFPNTTQISTLNKYYLIYSTKSESKL